MNKEEAKVRIDSIINHFEWRHGGYNDYVESDRDQAHQIIDQIEPDHPKVKLPREVGEAWIEYVDSRQTGRGIDKLDMALMFIVREKCPDDNVQSWYTVTPGALAILADAYRYGWKAYPEAKWYVQTPKEWWEEPDIPEWMHLDALRGVCSGFNEPGRTAFTRAELKQYHLDSDIFALAPVEEEK